MATPRRRTTRKSRVNISWNDRICNLVPSRDTQRDWSYQHALQAGMLTALALPTSVDLRKPWWRVGDQGKTGSCTGWAAADGVLRYQLVLAGRLPQDKRLSQRFVWMASKETDEFVDRPETFIERAGTSLKSVVDILRKYGCPLEDELPLHLTDTMYANEPNLLFASAAKQKCTSYVNLGKNLDAWKNWIANVGPILAGLRVDATWLNATASEGNLDTFNESTVDGSHAVSVVGYKGDRFIIRNSWGDAWGDRGFAYASSAYIRDAFFGESYGLNL